MATIDTIADRSTGTAIAGKAYFETSTNKFIVYSGSAWIEIDSDGTGSAFVNQWAASFDGAGDFLETSSDPNLTVKSVSFWFNQTSSKTSWVVSGIGGAAYPTYGGFGVDTSGKIKWNDGFGGGTSAASTFSYGTWNHFAAFHVPSGYTDSAGTATGNGGGWQVYVNNTRVDIQAASGAYGTTAVSTTNKFKIGREGERNLLQFNGKIDEVALFTSSLTASNVASMYNSGAPADLGANGLNLSPAVYYRMGDDSNDSPSASGSISSITDSSGNGHHLSQSTASDQPTFSQY